MCFCRSWTSAPPTSGGSTSQPSESGWAPVQHLGAYFFSIQMILTDSFLLILSSGEVVSYFLKASSDFGCEELHRRDQSSELQFRRCSFSKAGNTWVGHGADLEGHLKRDVSERNADPKCAALLLHVTSRCWWSCTILHILLAWRIEFSVFY